MRIRKGEKWYGRIVFVIGIGLTIGILTGDRGLEGLKDGKPHTFSKTHSALMLLLPAFIFPLGIWFVLRFFLLKTNDFICKYCRKEYGGSFETRKNVCKTCYEKRSH